MRREDLSRCYAIFELPKTGIAAQVPQDIGQSNITQIAHLELRITTSSRCIRASNSGRSSTRSVLMVSVSFIPTTYQNLWNASKFTRTVSFRLYNQKLRKALT